jgi:hypothetical protein
MVALPKAGDPCISGEARSGGPSHLLHSLGLAIGLLHRANRLMSSSLTKADYFSHRTLNVMPGKAPMRRHAK